MYEAQNSIPSTEDKINIYINILNNCYTVKDVRISVAVISMKVKVKISNTI